MAKFEKREVFKTEATARQHRPAAPTDKAGAPKPNRSRLWRVTSPDGTVRFVWSVGRAGALFQAARADDYKIEALDAKPMSVEKLTSAARSLSDEDRSLLIAALHADVTGHKGTNGGNGGTKGTKGK